MTDAFGVAGRQWLSRLVLPVDERDTINAALRQIDFIALIGPYRAIRATAMTKPTKTSAAVTAAKVGRVQRTRSIDD